jgi:hypothetical protein
MALGMSKKEVVRYVFKTDKHFGMVWENVRRYFEFDTVLLATDYQTKYKEHIAKYTPEAFFLNYGETVLNPMMNRKLKRAVDHDTFYPFMYHTLIHAIKSDPTLGYGL